MPSLILSAGPGLSQGGGCYYLYILHEETEMQREEVTRLESGRDKTRAQPESVFQSPPA